MVWSLNTKKNLFLNTSIDFLLSPLRYPNGTDLIFQDYKKLVDDKVSHILVDVRPSVELEICKLSTSNNFLSILILY